MSDQTRRAVLSAAVALPVLATTPAQAEPVADFDLTTRAGWEALARALRAAEAAEEAARTQAEAAQAAAWAECGERPNALDVVACALYLSRQADAERLHNVSALMGEADRLSGIAADLEGLALEAPAPDRAALAFKLELLDRAAGNIGLDLEGDRWAVLAADVRRFCG